MLFASRHSLTSRCLLGLFSWLLSLSLHGQSAATQEGNPLSAAPPAVRTVPQEQPKAEISEAPLAIDAATLVPEKLRTLTTIEFSGASLSEVAQWLREQTGLNVSLDTRSLEAVNVDENSPVSDQLENQPIYLLLDRLSNQKIKWRLDGGILRLQGSDDPSVLYNRQYNVGDLLDQKFKGEELEATLLATIVNESDWNDADGADGMVLLGDVLFIRQDDRTHRRVAGLLEAIRSPSRRVLVDDPLEHAAIRDALGQNISVDFKARSLGAVVDELAEQAAIDLRLDREALSSTRITERTPVTFELRDQSVQKTLDLLLLQLKLSWVLRDGVIWVTPAENAEQSQRTAVFDVRDICPDERSSTALEEALRQQVDSKSWSDSEGVGEICFAKPGVMVVMQTEQRLDAILELIGNYRSALRNSKPRISPEDDPEVVETKYYRLPTEVAEDLEKLLPTLVATDSWRRNSQADGVGTIQRIRSWSEVATAPGQGAGAAGESVLLPYSILIIEQRRKVHDQISDILRKIQYGDGGSEGGFGGGGLGGNGSSGKGGPAGGGIF